jgi:hypothetical protein
MKFTTNALSELLNSQLFIDVNDHMEMVNQSEMSDKTYRRCAFKKRQHSSQTEKRKDHNRTNNTNKKMYKSKQKFSHQSFITNPVANSVYLLGDTIKQNVIEYLKSQNTPACIISKFTILFSTLHLMKDETNPTKIISILNLSIQSAFPEVFINMTNNAMSIGSDVINYCKKLVGFNIFSQQSSFEPIDCEDANWISKLPSLVGNWEAFRQSPVFTRISSLITIIATLGFIDGDKLTINVRGLELFRLGTVKKHANALDLVSAILSTLEYFVTSGYEFFMTKNPRRFLFDDNDAVEFDDLYSLIVESTPHAQSMILPLMQLHYKGKIIQLDDDGYYRKLNECIDLAKKCKQIAKSSWQTSYFQTRLERMLTWRADYNAKRCNGKFRKQPLSVWLYGKPGVGKSTVTMYMIKSLLYHMGVPEEELGNIATINELEKYDSTVTGASRAFLNDDKGNSKIELVDKSPTQDIIDHNNNAPLFANKAELEGKARTPIRPDLTFYTSNRTISEVARDSSNCEESIIRRMIINIEMSVKPEFTIDGETRLDSKKVFAAFGSNPMPDAFNFKIKQASCQTQSGEIYLDKEWKHTLGEPAIFSFKEMMEYAYYMSTQHKQNQETLMEIDNTLVSKLELCPICRRVGVLCTCSQSTDTGPSVTWREEIARLDDDFEIQASEGITANIPEDMEITVTPWNSLADEDESSHSIVTEVDNSREDITLSYEKCYLWTLLPYAKLKSYTLQTRVSFDHLISGIEHIPYWLQTYGNYLIERFFTQNTYLQKMYLALYKNSLYLYSRALFSVAFIVAATLISIFYIILPLRLFIIIAPCVLLLIANLCILLIAVWYRDRLALLQKVGGSVLRTYNSILSMNWKKLAAYGAAAWGTYELIKMARVAWNDYIYMMKLKKSLEYYDRREACDLRNIGEKQSRLNPVNETEVAARDASVSDWTKLQWDPLHTTIKSKTATFPQLSAKIQKNLYHVTLVDDDGRTGQCDGIVLEGCNILMPLHVFAGRESVRVLCRNKLDGFRSSIKGWLSTKNAAVIEGYDLIYINANFLGPHTSLLDMFPLNTSQKMDSAYFMYKDKEGTYSESLVKYKPSSHSVGGITYVYSLPFNTFPGLCMGVLAAESPSPCIVGFHLQGINGKNIGAAVATTKELMERYVNILSNSGFLSAVSNGDFPTQMYDRQIVNQSAEVHQNSPLRYIDPNSKIEILGECPGRSSHTKSRVKKSCISDEIELYCGVPCKWGPPKFNNKRNWQATLQYSANPAPGFDPILLDWAMNDLKSDLIKIFTNPNHKKWIKDTFKPISDMEVLSGQDGKKFIDSMNFKASKGFPNRGPKEEWIERLSPDLFEGISCPVAVRQEVLDRVEDMKERIRRGERAYAIFQGCLKDEIKATSSDKVRAFEASDFAFQLLVRKYFLTFIRIICLFPLESETSVGVNAHGPEWDELSRYLNRYGEERVIAGDYSKYDLRMPAQTIMAVFKIYIDIAKECGTFSSDDLCIMRGIATEIAYHISAFNGDMLAFCGVMPSGNSLTVQVNCDNNKLNLRMAYANAALKQGYTFKSMPKFKVVATIGTYGDDFRGSVKQGYEWYNMHEIVDFLGKNDIVMTMPDKKSKVVAFLHDSETDYLKRKNVYNPDTGLYHGALDEDSIWKSLHCVLTSKTSPSPKAHAAGNVEGALREWFHHGREVFEKRHAQMIAVAKAARLESLFEEIDEDRGVTMNTLYDTYDDRLKAFKERYGIGVAI